MRYVDQIFSLSFEEANVKMPPKVQLLRTGKWKHPKYGEVEITKNTLQNLKRNFDEKVRGIDIAVDTEHKPEEGSKGWIKELFIEDDGNELWGFVEWTSLGEDLVKDKIYRYFSAEYVPTYTDPESGKTYTDVLMGAALTNRPFIKAMEPTMLSERAAEEYKFQKHFNEEDNLMANEPTIRKDPDIDKMKKRDDSVNPHERLKSVHTDLRLLSEAIMENKTTKNNMLQDLHACYSELDSILSAHNKQEAIKLAEDAVSNNPEIITLKEKVLEGERKLAEQERHARVMFAEGAADSFVCNDNNYGKILPKSRDKVVKLFAELDEEHAQMFAEILEELPAVIDYNERGSDAGKDAEEPDKSPEAKKLSESDESKQIETVTALIDQKVKSGMSLAEATLAVQKTLKL